MEQEWWKDPKRRGKWNRSGGKTLRGEWERSRKQSEKHVRRDITKKREKDNKPQLEHEDRRVIKKVR